jgi:hypothetical protein
VIFVETGHQLNVTKVMYPVGRKPLSKERLYAAPKATARPKVEFLAGGLEPSFVWAPGGFIPDWPIVAGGLASRGG